MDLHVRARLVRPGIAYVVIAEQRFALRLDAGEHLDLGVLHRQEVAKSVPRALILDLQGEQHVAMDGQGNAFGRFLRDADPVAAVALRKCLRMESVAVRCDGVDAGGEPVSERLRLVDQCDGGSSATPESVVVAKEIGQRIDLVQRGQLFGVQGVHRSAVAQAVQVVAYRRQDLGTPASGGLDRQDFNGGCAH
jgi:hypothetical protein